MKVWKAGVGKGRSQAVMWPSQSTSQLCRSLELEWLFIVVLSWAKMAGPPLNVGCPEEGV